MTETDAATSASTYARLRYRLLLIHLGASAGFLSALQLTGWSHAIARWWSARVANDPLIILGYLTVVGPFYYLAMFPLHVYGSFVVEHRFGLSRMTLAQWGMRELKQIGLSVLLGTALVEGFYALLRVTPEHWPLWATAGWVGVSIVLTRVFPTVVLPLFYKTTPLQNAALTQRLLALAQRVGLPALGVFRFDLGAETRKANAALAGLGKTRRILLSDTLLSGFPPDEIEGVLAHELAHHRYHHLVLMLALSAIGSWLALSLTKIVGARAVVPAGLQGLSDIAGYPLLMLWLSLLTFVSSPLQQGLSRRFEWQADRFAVAHAQPPHAFAGALRRLAQLNLADPNPPRWIVWLFYDHPPIADRIRAAEALALTSRE